MKRINYLLLFLAAILTTNISFSQEMPLVLSTRLHNSQIIFEGTVIKSTPYYNESGEYINTSNTVEITKLFKGDLECGTVEVITRGGIVDSVEVYIPHELHLLEGSSGIFMMEETEAPLSVIDFYPESNIEVISATYGAQSFLRYWWDGQEINISDLYMTYDSLAMIYASVIAETGVVMIDCNSNPSFEGGSSTNPHNMPTVENGEAYTYPVYDQSDYSDLLNSIRIDYNNSTHGRSGEKVFYNIRNLIVTGTGVHKSVEFDIAIKDNLGNKYLDLSMVRLEYGNLSFGSNIVANQAIEVTRGTLNSDTNCYADIDVYDDIDNPNVVIMYATEKYLSTCKKLVLTTEQTIIHVKIRLLNCNMVQNITLADTADLFFPSTVLSSSAFADSPSDIQNTYYELLQHSQTEITPACKPDISSFSPMSLAGGTKEILTINGNQFGSVMGKVFFYNADGGGTRNVWTDSLDIISWTNTEIKLYVPSFSEGVFQNTAQWNQTVGTGHFSVRAADYSIGNSNFPLEVRYSAANNTYKNQNVIAPHDYDNGRYELHCSGAVAAYKGGDMKKIINKAIEDWRCLTGIQWFLGADLAITTDSTKYDGSSIIQFNPYLDSNVVAEGIQRTIFIPTGANTYNYALEVDMEINPNFNFDCDSSSVNLNAGEVDLYAAILHELGHMHGLKHVSGDASKIMFASNNSSSGNRKIDLENDYSCDEGGSHVLWISRKFSTNQLLGMNASKIAVDANPLCSHYVGIIEGKERMFEMLVYPNPVNEKLNMVIDSEVREDVVIEIYNGSGRVFNRVQKSLMVGENTILLDTNTLSTGFYIIEVYDMNQTIMFRTKFIKK